MNPWGRRLALGLLMVLLAWAHGLATASLPNTPAALLAYHGSAALIDWLTLLMVPLLLSGRLARDTEWLMWAAIIGNFGGWLAYMAYAPPVYYNTFIHWLSVLQLVRLGVPDRHAVDYSRVDLVRHRDPVGGIHHTRKTQP